MFSDATEYKFLRGRNYTTNRIASKYTTDGATKEKCLRPGSHDTGDEADVFGLDCGDKYYCPYLQWSLKDVGGGKFLIYYAMDGWCMKKVGGDLKVTKSCNEADPEVQWTRQMG